jgi:hypothetical protein
VLLKKRKRERERETEREREREREKEEKILDLSSTICVGAQQQTIQVKCLLIR